MRPAPRGYSSARVLRLHFLFSARKEKNGVAKFVSFSEGEKEMGSKKRVSPFSFRERITHHFSSLNPIKNGSSGSCFVSPPPPTPRTGARIAAAAFCRST